MNWLKLLRMRLLIIFSKKYNSIEDCPLSVFTEVLETGNFAIVGGESKWMGIFNEYLFVNMCYL